MEVLENYIIGLLEKKDQEIAGLKKMIKEQQKSISDLRELIDIIRNDLDGTVVEKTADGNDYYINFPWVRLGRDAKKFVALAEFTKTMTAEIEAETKKYLNGDEEL